MRLPLAVPAMSQPARRQVYGGWSNDGGVVSNVIMAALHHQPITLYGDGSQTRAFCFVDDLVEGLIRLMATPHAVTGPLNLGNPGEFTIHELAQKVVHLTGSRSPIATAPLPEDDPLQRRPDITQAEALLDWRPTVPLDDGLRRTIAYFQGLLR
jgi:UDP-glucuronate decarboxylase